MDPSKPGADRLGRVPTRGLGLTLIELLVSIGLGVVLVGLAYSAFTRVKASTERATVRVDLHASASVLRSHMQRDFGNLAPSLAFFARSRPQVVDASNPSRKTDTIEVVFMLTTAPLVSQSNFGEQFKSDYHWVRWRFVRAWRDVAGTWKPIGGRLYRSSSRPSRSWRTLSNATAFKAPGPLIDPVPGYQQWTSYAGREWFNMPRPLRDASQGIESLENNRYGMDTTVVDPTSAPLNRTTAAYGDIGDLTDLDSTEELVTDRMRDFAIGWVDAHGAVTTLSTGVAADHRIDGLYVDVTGPAGNPALAQLARRPRVMRVAFGLADGKTGIAQDFSFSVATPGLQPQIGQ